MKSPLIKAALIGLCFFSWDSGSVSSQEGDIYDRLLRAPGRPDADLHKDALRKPSDVLRFMGIKPGMTILDIFSGGGYYAELLSHLVGNNGEVIAHNNSAYEAFVGTEIQRRYKDGRLTNVKQMKAEANEIDLQPNSLDGALMILGYHDLYYSNDNWAAIDVNDFLTRIRKALKPGAILGLVDHRAPEGSGHEVGTSLHRISPSVVIKELLDHGFVLEGEADFLANPDDPLTIPMYDPSIRGKTDRFVLRFVKASSSSP